MRMKNSVCLTIGLTFFISVIVFVNANKYYKTVKEHSKATAHCKKHELNFNTSHSHWYEEVCNPCNAYRVYKKENNK